MTDQGPCPPFLYPFQCLLNPFLSPSPGTKEIDSFRLK